MATKIVGLDIGSAGIKVAVLNSSLRGFELIEAGSVPYESSHREPSEEDLANALQEVVQNVGTSGVFIVSAPATKVSYKRIELPFEDLRIVQKALPNALDEVVPFQLEEKHWDFERIAITEEGNSEILAAIIDPNEMKNLLEQLSKFGIDPRSVVPAPLALAGLYNQILPQTNSLELIVDIGHKHTHFAAVANGKPVELRTIIWGGADITDAIAKEFNLDWQQAEQGKRQEAFLPLPNTPLNEHQKRIASVIENACAPLIKEIMYSVEVAQVRSGTKVSRILLTGGTSKLTNLPEYIKQTTGIECQQLHLLSDEFNRLPEPFDETLIALPLALATYGLGRKGKVLNLRSGEFAYAGEIQYYRRQILQVIFGLVAVLIFALMSVESSFIALNNEEEMLEKQLKQITQRVIGKPITNVKRAKAIINETISGKVGNEELPIPELPVTVILAELGNRLKASGVEAQLKEISIKTVRKKMTVVIKGITDSIPSVGKIEEALAAYPCFKKVIPGATRTTVSGTKIEFSFEIDVGCEGAKAVAETSPETTQQKNNTLKLQTTPQPKQTPTEKSQQKNTKPQAPSTPKPQPSGTIQFGTP